MWQVDSFGHKISQFLVSKKGLRYKWLFDAGISEKPFDKMKPKRMEWTQERIQNPVKYLRWSILQIDLAAFSC